MAARAKQDRDAVINNLKTTTKALTTYTANDAPSRRQLQNRIDAVATSLSTLNERQTNYITMGSLANNPDWDADAESAHVEPSIDAANEAIDKAEEKLDNLVAANQVSPEVEAAIRLQEVHNAFDYAQNVNDRINIIKGTSDFQEKDIDYVRSELGSLKVHCDTVIKPAQKLLIDRTLPNDRAAVIKTQHDLLVKLQNMIGAFEHSASRVASTSTPTPAQSPRTTPSSTSSQAFIAKMKPPMFSGDPRHFASFQRDFEEIVAKHRSDPQAQRYTIINECLPAESKELVHNLPTMEAIWARLKDKYGQKRDIVAGVLRDITKVPEKNTDPQQNLIDLVDKIERGMADLRTVDALPQLTNEVVVSKIETRLTNRLKIKWFDTQDELEGDDNFERMWNFLKKERKSALAFVRQRQDQEGEKQPPEADQGKDKDKRGRGGRAHHGQGRKGQNDAPSSRTINASDRCFLHPDGNHFTRQCRNFLNMSPDERGNSLQENNACKFCLASKAHNVIAGTPCPRESQWSPCQENNCGKNHNRLLHGCSVPGICSFTVGPQAAQKDSLLLYQEVPTPGGSIRTLWDPCATVTLITRKAVKKGGLVGTPITFDMTVVGGVTTTEESMCHHIELIDKHHRRHVVTAYEVDKISDEFEKVQVNKVVHMFKNISAEDVSRPHGEAELLVGMQFQHLHPVRMYFIKQLGIYSSNFGTGRLLGGTDPKLGLGIIGGNTRSIVNHITIANVFPINLDTIQDFFTSEAFGVNVKPKCEHCLGCKDCKFLTQDISRIELNELNLIKTNMKLDEKAGRFNVQYPFKVDPNVLRDNRMQALALLKRLEKGLNKNPAHAETYCKEMNKYIERGVIVRISPEEMKDWAGPRNYVSHHAVFKPESTSTPVRIVMNSSLTYQGKSLNSILAKGPNILNDMFGVLIRFRFWVYALVWDITKAYQQLVTGPTEKHVRRILWRDMNDKKEPDTYGLTCVTFGDRCAAAQLEVAKEEVSSKFGYINPDAAERIRRDSYVDDGATGSNSREELEVLRRDIPIILGKGGFKIKGMVASGDPVEKSIELWGSSELARVLGIGWNPSDDIFKFSIRINLTKKHKGSHLQEDLTQETMPRLLEVILTRRIVLGIANTCHDPMGLLSPITVQMKLQLRDLFSKELELDWDTALPLAVKEDWLTLFQLLKRAEELTFKRSVRPINAIGQPDLVNYWDGSDEAMCTASYVVWQTSETPCITLLCAKTRVSPLNRVSTPRSEMQAAVMSVRLRAAITKFSNIKYASIYHIGDSECTLAMLRKDSVALKEFMGNRVTECLENSQEEQWFHTETSLNVSDLGTRRLAKIEDLMPNSVWQQGPLYLQLSKDQWKITRDINSANIPPEEVKKKKNHVGIVLLSKPLINITRLGRSYDFLVRTVARILKINRTISSGTLKEFFNKTLKIDNISTEDIKMSEVYLIQLAQQDKVMKNFKKDSIKSLRPTINENGIVVVGGRVPPKHLQHKVGANVLPILARESQLAYHYTKKMHEESHTGVSSTAGKVRSKYWVIGGRRLAKKIRNKCIPCRKADKELCQQQMAPLPLHRVTPAPAFLTTALDLAGPFKVRDQVKKRTEMKVWVVLFTCTATRAVDLEVAPGYDEDSFIQALKKFMCRRDAPREIISDQGSQLVAASKDVAKKVTPWNWKKIQESTKQGTTWTFVPKEGQHQNGVAESLVKVMKKSLHHVMGNASLTFSEFQLACSEVAYITNNRPLGILPSPGDDILEPLTPNHLLLGRSGREIPPDEEGGKISLTARYRYVQRLLEDWWSRWTELVYPSLVPSYKWLQKHRNLQPGDICLMKYGKMPKGIFRLCRVQEVKTSHDGLVRRVIVVYKNKGAKKFKEIDRPVQSLCVIVPIEEQGEEAVEE